MNNIDDLQDLQCIDPRGPPSLTRNIRSQKYVYQHENDAINFGRYQYMINETVDDVFMLN